MLVLNAKRLTFYLIEVCLLATIFYGVEGNKKDRKKSRESYVPCPHSKCQCKPDKTGEVVAKCIKVSERLPEFLALNVTFAELILAHRNLTELPENGFRGVRMRMLDVGSNPLRSDRISDKAFEGLDDILETLWLSDCSLTDVPNATLSNLRKLKVLHFEDNRMTEISARFLSDNKQLRELFLNRNNIRSVSVDAFSELKNLRHLKLGQNQIQSLPARVFKFLSNLTSLDLSQNFLRAIVPGTFDGLKSLRWLELESNLITSLTRDAFRGARNLKNMKFENNPLTSIADNVFRTINKLGYLSIDIANVSSLTALTFGGMSKLETLSIGEITHSQLPDGFFSSMRSLKRMSLYDNMGKFTGLRKSMFGEKEKGFPFKNLSVFVSPMRSCRCSEAWIKEMTDLGTYVHGHCSDNRPLSCTNKSTDKTANNDKALKQLSGSRRKTTRKVDSGTCPPGSPNLCPGVTTRASVTRTEPG